MAFKCIHKNKEYPSSLYQSTHKEGVIMHIEMLVLCSKTCLGRNYKSTR